MRVFVTDAGGVTGRAAAAAVLGAGHAVRVLTGDYERDRRRWPRGIELLAGDVADAKRLEGAARDFDAIVHVASLLEEAPPERTFERVVVGGTRNVIAEAARSGLPRIVFVSTLGAGAGDSAYRRAMGEAEAVVRGYEGEWLILRAGYVYGPGDPIVSRMLRLIRAIPAVPVVDGGEQRFQPIWYRDLADALVRALGRPALSRQALEIAGPEVVTVNDVIDRLARITDRPAVRVPLPSILAGLGAGAVEVLGLPRPVESGVLAGILDGSVLEPGAPDALTAELGVTPTALDEGLSMLADELPEQLPDEGVGELERKRFWADIVGSRVPAPGLLDIFREQLAEVMPIPFDVEPGTPEHVREGLTLTAATPPRGHIQMRVVESTDRRVTFATLQGHPLAGVVQFVAQPAEGGAVRFMVETDARAATSFDYVVMHTVGALIQNLNWETVVERMVERSGGKARDGVQSSSAYLTGEAARRAEEEIEKLVAEHHKGR